MTSEHIGSALDRVVNSKTFSRSRSLQDFLTFIVTQSLGPDQSLKEYRIGVDALKRGGGFDPAENSIVRVQAYRLRAKLADYYQHEGQAEDVRIDLEPGSYTPVIRECAVVATLRSLRFPGLILDILPLEGAVPCDASIYADARFADGAERSAFLFSALSSHVDQLVRAGLRQRHAAARGRIHLQLEFRWRSAKDAMRVITYLSDVDSRHVIWSQAVTHPAGSCGGSLEKMRLEKAGAEIAQAVWQRIDAVLSCNG